MQASYEKNNIDFVAGKFRGARAKRYDGGIQNVTNWSQLREFFLYLRLSRRRDERTRRTTRAVFIQMRVKRERKWKERKKNKIKSQIANEKMIITPECRVGLASARAREIPQEMTNNHNNFVTGSSDTVKSENLRLLNDDINYGGADNGQHK